MGRHGKGREAPIAALPRPAGSAGLGFGGGEAGGAAQRRFSPFLAAVAQLRRQTAEAVLRAEQQLKTSRRLEERLGDGIRGSESLLQSARERICVLQRTGVAVGTQAAVADTSDAIRFLESLGRYPSLDAAIVGSFAASAVHGVFLGLLDGFSLADRSLVALLSLCRAAVADDPAFERFFALPLLQTLRGHLCSRFDVRRDSARLLSYLGELEAHRVFPRSLIGETILWSFVAPRLSEEQQLDGTFAVGWLLPWFAAFPEYTGQLQDLFAASFAREFSRVLSGALDSGTLQAEALLQWRAVLSQNSSSWHDTVEAVLVEHFRSRLGSLCVGPGGVPQDVSAVQQLVEAFPLLSAASLAGLLQSSLFPRLAAALAERLAQPRAGPREIAQWYLGWRSLFPERLFGEPELRSCFTRLLRAMDRAADPEDLFG